MNAFAHRFCLFAVVLGGRRNRSKESKKETR
jgi:hypothetical protein